MYGKLVDFIAEFMVGSVDERLGFCRYEKRERAVSTWMGARR
jgi:hypothetical protein